MKALPIKPKVIPTRNVIERKNAVTELICWIAWMKEFMELAAYGFGGVLGRVPGCGARHAAG